MLENVWMVSEIEYNRIKSAFNESFLEKDTIAKGGFGSCGEAEVKWHLKNDRQEETLFGYHEAATSDNTYTYKFYVYPLAYKILNYIDLQKESIKASKSEHKQKEYIITEDCLRSLLSHHACYCAVEPNGGHSNPYVVSAVKYKYPEAYREDEGIYWDVLEDMFLKSYIAAGEVRENKK